MERRVLFAAVLSAVFLAAYYQLVGVNRNTHPFAAAGSTKSIEGESAIIKGSETSLHPSQQEEAIELKNARLAIEIGTSTGNVRKATIFLRGPLQHQDAEPVEISNEFPLEHIQSTTTNELSWKLIRASKHEATFDVEDQKQTKYEVSYILEEDHPVVDVSITPASESAEKNRLVLTTTWARTGSLLTDRSAWRYNQIETFVLGKGTGNTLVYKRLGIKRLFHVEQWKNAKILAITERYFCQALRSEQLIDARAVVTPQGISAAEAAVSFNHNNYIGHIYIGPRDFFLMRDAGFSESFPIGMLGQIGLILVIILNWIYGITRNYGVGIILLSLMVSCVAAPFTLLSLKSMKKMQELKPMVDKIMAQHKNNPQKANQEVFALYKEYKVSPLSGCLPMVLQMPIFIALFQAISHFIGLRGARFLWIKDLSLPDRLTVLPVSLPVFGSSFNILPIIMAIAMYLQTKMSQQRMASSSQDPSTAMMSGPAMSILFGVMFYQFPAGLVLYWLTNSVMSLVWFKMAN